jgi:hypothetical protein
MVSVDPEMKASVDCYCLRTASGRATVTVISDSFEPFEIAKDSKSTSERLQGYLTGKSKSSKRPEYRSNSGNSSGKINLASIEEQEIITSSVPIGSVNKADTEAQDLSPRNTFDLSLQASGHVRLETVSWIEIIKRKHGFGDKFSLAPEAGRTASAQMRSQELNSTVETNK